MLELRHSCFQVCWCSAGAMQSRVEEHQLDLPFHFHAAGAFHINCTIANMIHWRTQHDVQCRSQIAVRRKPRSVLGLGTENWGQEIVAAGTHGQSGNGPDGKREYSSMSVLCKGRALIWLEHISYITDWDILSCRVKMSYFGAVVS